MLADALLNIIVCPSCKSRLKMIYNQQELFCHSCGLFFPIREGIPIMLTDDCSPTKENMIIKIKE